MNVLLRPAHAIGFILISTWAGACPQADAQDANIVLSQKSTTVEISIDEDPFATYQFSGYAKPILYPLYAPGNIPITRHYPMKPDVEGEARDHPHHKSVWFAHGDVNGHDFWSEKANIRTTDISIDQADGRLVANGQWRAGDEIVCTDQTVISFLAGQTRAGHWRAIDYNVTIRASHGDVTLGDTKEGTFAVRTHPELRLIDLEQQPAGNAVNSEGIEGKSIWGQKARWVYYTGTIDGRSLGLAIFDHPDNFRHPTTWHAREYGLIGANPFGLHHFQGAERGTGDLVLQPGEEQSFRYRILLTGGHWDSEQVEQAFKSFAPTR